MAAAAPIREGAADSPSRLVQPNGWRIVGGVGRRVKGYEAALLPHASLPSLVAWDRARVCPGRGLHARSGGRRAACAGVPWNAPTPPSYPQPPPRTKSRWSHRTCPARERRDLRRCGAGVREHPRREPSTPAMDCPRLRRPNGSRQARGLSVIEATAFRSWTSTLLRAENLGP